MSKQNDKPERRSEATEPQSAEMKNRPNQLQLTIDEMNLLLQTVPRTVAHPADLRVDDAIRKHAAHGVFISPTNPTIVYVTVCCDDRIPWLATDRNHELLLSIWQDSSHWVVGRYVIMPDHLHLFASPQPTAVLFDSWVTYFKSQFTKRRKDPSCVWQTEHWDTRIRSLRHYEEKSVYMWNNPVRAGLVTHPDEWKYKGVVHELRWE